MVTACSYLALMGACMRLSNTLVITSLAFALAGCGGFGRKSSASPGSAAAPAAAAAAPSTTPTTASSATAAPAAAVSAPPASAPAPAVAAPAVAPAAPAVASTTVSPTSYYKVIDVSSGKVFYTLKVNRIGHAVVFTDEKTGAETTLQNSQVLPVQKMEYTTGTAPTPTAAPVPAPAVTPSLEATTPPAAPLVQDAK